MKKIAHLICDSILLSHMIKDYPVGHSNEHPIFASYSASDPEEVFANPTISEAGV